MRNKKAKQLRKSATQFVNNRSKGRHIEPYIGGQHPFEIIPEKGLVRVRKGIPRVCNAESARGVYHLFKKLYSGRI